MVIGEESRDMRILHPFPFINPSISTSYGEQVRPENLKIEDLRRPKSLGIHHDFLTGFPEDLVAKYDLIKRGILMLGGQLILLSEIPPS